MELKNGKLYWYVVAPACGAIALTSLSSGMSTGPWAFAAGFGIGICLVATLAGVVACVKHDRAA